jgi:hypothetical protein
MIAFAVARRRLSDLAGLHFLIDGVQPRATSASTAPRLRPLDEHARSSFFLSDRIRS